jgi:hypothetical protein
MVVKPRLARTQARGYRLARQKARTPEIGRYLPRALKLSGFIYDLIHN